MSEDWETYCLEGKCASQVGYVYDRPVCFQVQSVIVPSLSGGGDLVLKQDGKFFMKDGNSVGQDGKCNQQAIEIMGRTLSRWVEPQSGCSH